MKKFIDRVGIIPLMVYASVYILVFWIIFTQKEMEFWTGVGIGIVTLVFLAPAIVQSFFLEDK